MNDVDHSSLEILATEPLILRTIAVGFSNFSVLPVGSITHCVSAGINPLVPVESAECRH
ncbi:hypothetical protein [Nostoc sp. MG11]|uniref:hypothetical protein n=1 Tax=Nostoc sp. MG11 TaxID=2721166 RepID=UPI001868648D|nr:hypothetical protein [Nostoc sp. MG11]